MGIQVKVYFFIFSTSGPEFPNIIALADWRCCHFMIKRQKNKKVTVNVSHSLIAVRAVGVRVPLFLVHSKRKVEPIPLLLLLYPKGTHLLLG